MTGVLWYRYRVILITRYDNRIRHSSFVVNHPRIGLDADEGYDSTNIRQVTTRSVVELNIGVYVRVVRDECDSKLPSSRCRVHEFMATASAKRFILFSTTSHACHEVWLDLV